jgi:hypothetical protein
MLCLYCKKRIGLLRRLTDDEYCCTGHRVKMREKSARALRDLREQGLVEDDDEVSTMFVKRLDGVGAGKRPAGQSSVASSLIFALLLVGAIYIGTMSMSEGPAQASERAPAKASLGNFRKLLRSQAAVRLTDDFKSGTSSWTSSSRSPGGARDWVVKDGLLRPGSLRIWKDSIPLTDYNVELTGQIEQKGMGWAYRAKNDRNYYASKLVMSRPGPLPTVDLVRYAVVNGAETRRTRLPLPMNVRAETLYKIQMTVKGADFSTMINGQMVDTWSDDRLTTGGVGLFADAGEVALVRYITVTDKDTLLGRVLSHLGMVHPSMLVR